MGVISKSNPKGVDSVLDAIQQYIYPNLLGEGWTDYVCYPRANKNQRSGNIIPEVAQDQKDYIEVLFSDKHDATSFFLVDDVVAIDNEERLIVQRASIIFQVNLKNLFPGVTTHRADEELHVLLTELFTQNEELFVDVVGYTTTPDKVYSDLRIGDYNSDMWNDDMSEFHVVKYDFTVVYDLDDCSHRFAPTCAGVSIVIDGELFEVVPSGGIYSYSSAGSPASNQVNGASKTPILSGGSKNFIIQDTGGNPVTVTQISDSASEFIGEVEAGFGYIAYNRPYLTQTISYADYDEAWRKANGGNTYNDSIPDGVALQEVEPDMINGRFDYLRFFNKWGHKFRFTGVNGGYYDEADGNYYDVNGVLSDLATEFPIGTKPNRYLIYDHLTGFALTNERHSATFQWLDALNNNIGFSFYGLGIGENWFTPSMDEMIHTLRISAAIGFYSIRSNPPTRPFFTWSQPTYWSGTTNPNSTTIGYYLLDQYSGSPYGTLKTNVTYDMHWFIFDGGYIPQP